MGEVRWAKWYLIKKTGAPRAHQPISHLNSLEVSDRLPEEPFVTNARGAEALGAPTVGGLRMEEEAARLAAVRQEQGWMGG